MTHVALAFWRIAPQAHLRAPCPQPSLGATPIKAALCAWLVWRGVRAQVPDAGLQAGLGTRAPRKLCLTSPAFPHRLWGWGWWRLHSSA